jgi:hypothetical protein
MISIGSGAFALLALAISSNIRFRRALFLAIAFMAILSCPRTTYSKLGLSIYFKQHLNEYKRLTDIMRRQNIINLSVDKEKLWTNCYDGPSGFKPDSSYKLVHNDSICQGRLNREASWIEYTMKNLKIPDIKKRNENYEIKVDGLKRNRIWVLVTDSTIANNQQKYPDSVYVKIASDAFFYYPKSALTE